MIERQLGDSPGFGIRASCLDPSPKAKDHFISMVDTYLASPKGKGSSLAGFWAKVKECYQ
eukprot:11155091-Lingulodinium_polyedra.AAC.1